MSRLRSPSWRQPLRVLWLALLAFGLILQPVLAAVGELHELAHAGDAAQAQFFEHAHLDHTTDAEPGLAAADAPEPGPGGTLHVLLHFAHCCGQSTAVSMPAIELPALSPMTGHPPWAAAQRPLDARTHAPYRPPITA